MIGTVSTTEKAAFARKMGADEIIFYRDEDAVARTRALTDGRGVSLVLDHARGPEFYSDPGALHNWETTVSYNAFAGLLGGNPDRAKYVEVSRHPPGDPVLFLSYL